MKRKTIFAVLFSLFAITVFSNPLQSNRKDQLLNNIQDKIYQAFLKTFTENSPKKLLKIEKKLAAVEPQTEWTTYWRAYAKFYITITDLKSGDKAKAQNDLESGITLLESFSEKHSESYALLANLQNFSLQYAGASAPEVMDNIKANLKTAVELDSTNLRAWYVLATNDFYTPAAFGGGKKCKEYLLKAVALPTQSVEDNTLPSWGKNDAYAMLVKVYLKEDDHQHAKEVLREALKLYPDDYMLLQLKKAFKE